MGFEYMCRTGIQTRDSIGYMYRTGEGTDRMQEAFKTKVWGEREQTLTQGPGVTSGLGGRGWSP